MCQHAHKGLCMCGWMTIIDPSQPNVWKNDQTVAAIQNHISHLLFGALNVYIKNQDFWKTNQTHSCTISGKLYSSKLTNHSNIISLCIYIIIYIHMHTQLYIKIFIPNTHKYAYIRYGMCSTHAQRIYVATYLYYMHSSTFHTN